MKSFIASLVIFTVLLCMIIWNCCYTVRICNRLEILIDNLPPAENASQAVRELRDFWEHESAKISISISLQIIHKADDCFTELQYAADYGDVATFEKNRYLAKMIVQELKEGELPHPKNWI